MKDKKELEKLKNLSYDEAEDLMGVMPMPFKVKMYAKYLPDEKLKTVIEQWELSGDTRQLKELAFRIRKERRPFLSKTLKAYA